VGKVDALLDVLLKALDSLAQELLLLLGDALQRVGGVYDAIGSKLNGDGEEVDASSLGNSLTSGNTRQVDVAGLDKTLLALGSTKQLLGKSEASICHGEGSRTSTILGLDDLVTTKLQRLTRASYLSLGMLTEGLALLKRGRMVSPE